MTPTEFLNDRYPNVDGKATYSFGMMKVILQEYAEHISTKHNVDIFQLEHLRLLWSYKTFPDATPVSSLLKLKEEINEVTEQLNAGPFDVDAAKLHDEYADCLMCLLDSAGRAGVTVLQIFEAFADKFERNKKRTWEKNPDNTYSHIK